MRLICLLRYRSLWDWLGAWFQPSLAAAGIFAAGLAFGADWKFQSSIGANSTLTDNVGLTSSGQQTDLVTSISPSVSASLDGARLKVKAQYTPTINQYASTSQNNYIANYLNAMANLEAVEKFFYVDASASIFQSFLSPFAPQPTNTANATANRTQTTVLGVSPYIKSTTASGISYSLRDSNLYTTDNTSTANDTYFNQVSGRVDGPAGNWIQWGGDYDYTYTKFQGSNDLTSQLARLRLTHALDPELSVSATGGYETNDYSVQHYTGAIYGGGLSWDPTPRTRLYGNAEHRFFGTSYSGGFEHRTRLTIWNLQGSRNTSSYPQQLAIPAGNTQSVLNALFQARIPDPIQRQQAVDAYIRQAGLPPTLISPLSYYTNSIYLNEYINGSIAIVGSRNVVTFAAYWNNSKPITATGLSVPGVFSAATEVITVGASVTASHSLTPYTSVALTGAWSNARGTDTTSTTPTVSSSQDIYLLTLSHQFSPKTYGSLGLRYQRFDTTNSGDVKEHALLAGITHNF